MLNGIVNLALVTGAGLCLSLLAYFGYQVVSFVSNGVGLRLVVERLARYHSTHLDPQTE